MANFIKRIFGKPTPLQLASLQLHEAEVHRLEAMLQVEYYQAVEKMYRERAARLKRDIVALTEEYEESKPYDPTN